MLAPLAGRGFRCRLTRYAVLFGLLLLVAVSVGCTNRPSRRIPSAAAGTLPAGANGDIKVHNSSRPPDDETNDPKVCEFYLAAFNFDPNSGQSWTIHEQPGDTVVSSGSITVDQNGNGRSADMTLPDGLYKVEWPAPPGANKSKVFKVECASPSPSPTPSTTPTPSQSPSVGPTTSPSETPPSPEESGTPSPIPSPTESVTPPPPTETPSPEPSPSESPGPTPSPTRSPSGGGGPNPGGGSNGGSGSGNGSGGNGSQVGGNPSGGVGTGGGGTAGIEDLAVLVLGAVALIGAVGAGTFAYRRRRTQRSP
jgi:uncharacterized membrane protein YgcG